MGRERERQTERGRGRARARERERERETCDPITATLPSRPLSESISSIPAPVNKSLYRMAVRRWKKRVMMRKENRFEKRERENY